MAKQVIDIGTNANDGTGTPIRSAFDICNDNFTELYSDDAGDVGSITATAPIVRDQATGAVTISLANSGVTYAKIQNTTTANRVLGAVSAGIISEVQVSNAMLADDSVTFSKLGVEYTAAVALTSASTIAVNTALADVFTYTAGHSATLNFTNVGIGDMKTFQITASGGSFTVTLGTTNGASCTYNKIAGTYSDAAGAKNLIQLKWVATNVAWFTISQIAS